MRDIGLNACAAEFGRLRAIRYELGLRTSPLIENKQECIKVDALDRSHQRPEADARDKFVELLTAQGLAMIP